MPSFHQQLLQRVVATQQALATVPAARVFVEREAPIEKDECPAVNVALVESRQESIVGSDGEWDLLQLTVKLKLAVHTRVEPQTTLADPVIAEAHAALLADPSLGGVALRLSFEGSERRSAAADGSAGIYELSYEATVVVDERTLALHTL